MRLITRPFEFSNPIFGSEYLSKALIAFAALAGIMSLDTTQKRDTSNDLVLKVPVHHFSWCFCHDQGSGHAHLKLHTSEQNVEPGKAIALSYGMGDFDRKVHVFGHSDEPPYEPIRLTFGPEWDVPQLMSTFVFLSNAHGAIWFDQLSIPQEEAQIPIHLQNMPNIYHFFEVVILLPNAPCPCLKSAVDSWSAGEAVYTDNKGDFSVLKVASQCLNAFPISSYHFRLWTKQEFSYARTIRIHYCGPPAGECSRGIYDWFNRSSRIPTQEHRFLGLWARRKYASCLEQVDEKATFREHTAWSLFRAAQTTGRSDMLGAMTTFQMRADIDFFEQNINSMFGLYAKFVLGDKLERLQNSLADVFLFSDLHSKHVASVKQDMALAVFPAIKGYRVPTNAIDMTLPALIEDGLDQYERLVGRRCHSKLPQGLFDISTTGSAFCRPSLYLRADRIHDLNDAYGALSGAAFDSMAAYDDLVTLHFRGHRHPPASRLPHSKTYIAAFASKSTADAQDFMKRVGKIAHMNFGHSRVTSEEAWAEAVLHGKIPVPRDKWPSPAHETAVFAESLHATRLWGDWPKVDHERVCFELMCDFVCIHPDVAREKKLGLVVRTNEPPWIGFVNGDVYEGMRHIEKQQILATTTQEPVTRDNTILPEDWVTILITDPTQPLQRKFLAYEAIFSDRTLEEKSLDPTQPKRLVRMCSVVGVWFWCGKDDPYIGAESDRRPNQDYDAVLV